MKGLCGVMKSVMKHQFSRVPEANIPRSVFNRNCGYKTTFDSGYLIPFFTDEVLPGDTFNVNVTLFARLNTLIVPVMDNMFLDTFFFFVPNRLVWSNWAKFMGEKENPEDDDEYMVPQLVSPSNTGWTRHSLSDYFGLPTGVVGLSVSSMYHRAYNLIWNEWFRDQNLQDSVDVPKGDGPDSNGSYVLLRRCKRHDYFTSCLPWPQKGPGVQIPLGEEAPIMRRDASSDGVKVFNVGGNISPIDNRALYVDGGYMSNQGDNAVSIDPNGTLYADLNNATAYTINSLRLAFQAQRLLEKMARGGTRYTEIVRSLFGVVSPDARLQRPEYLGGGSAPIMVTPVAQTFPSVLGDQQDPSVALTPQANLSAFGVVASNRNGFTKSFTEHGMIIGLCQVRADLTYQQGIPRQFLKSSGLDFYIPTLAHLGEQGVYNKEIFAQGPAVVDINNDPVDNNLFGYQERYAEYRYKPSMITGKLRSTDSESLDVWHLSQKFETLPTLSSAFIEDNPPVDRVIAVQDEPEFTMDCYIQNKTVRPMPVYSVPGLIDHF